MSDVSAFFGSGYTEKKREPKPEPKPKETWPEVFASEESKVAINVMGDLYEGMDKIEIIAGEIIVDGIRTGKMPITSGTWVKTLKGEHWKNPHDQKNTLSIWKGCDMMDEN